MTLAERMAQLREDAESGGRRLGDSARTIGDMVLAEPGCEAWARTEGGDARMRFPRRMRIICFTESMQDRRFDTSLQDV